MEWMEVISGLALVMFIVVMLPTAKNAIQNSPKGSSADWLGFVIPIAIIALFVILLIQLV